jgi:hypothetical protein
LPLHDFWKLPDVLRRSLRNTGPGEGLGSETL